VNAFRDYALAKPNRYVVNGGDDIENTPGDFMSKGCADDQVLTREEQAEKAVLDAKSLEDRLLVIQNGNHEKRNYKGGYPTLAKAMHENGFTVGTNLVDLSFTVGDILYRGQSWHVRPGMTINNRFNGHLRARRESSDKLHFVLVAHWHRPALQWWHEKGVDYVDAIAGTFKQSDRFFQDSGASFSFGIPSLTFYPNEHRIDAKLLRRSDLDTQ